MSRIKVITAAALVACLFTLALADEITPDQMRRLVTAELKTIGVAGDSVGTPLRVTGYGEKFKDFLIVPVIRNGVLVSVYRDDPKRNSVTEICSKANARTLKLGLFSLEGARHEMDRQGVVDPAPRLISVGPISLLGALTAGWYHDTGGSFVLLSLSGRLVTESDIARYWPEHLEALRAVGR